MNPLIQVSNPQICNKHNQPILLYDPDPNKEGSCLICIQERTGMISAESYLQKLNINIEQETGLCNNNIQLFQDQHNAILNHKNNLISSLDKILKSIVQQMERIGLFQEKLKQMSWTSTDHQKTITEISMKFQIFQKQNEQVKAQIKLQLLDYFKNYLKSAKELLNQWCLQPKISIKDSQIDARRFQYEIIQQTLKNEKYDQSAFAFNKESNILIFANNKEIVVYDFKEGVIVKEIQRLTQTSTVHNIYFMNQTNAFISQSYKQIIIWQFNINKKIWFALSQFNEDQKNIYCITMNKSEDLLIYGMDGKSIKFWNKINFIWRIQQIITSPNKSAGKIQLSEKEDKLIFHDWEQIWFLEKENDNKWRIVQTIYAYGQFCFTIGNQVFIQLQGSDIMLIYEYNQGRKLFEKVQEIQAKNDVSNNCSGFQIQYIQKQKVVAVKHGKFLNFFKINSDGHYHLCQTTEFKDSSFCGILSGDGEYLLAYESSSKQQIQVRRRKCIE